jgi:hypothetical protein
MTVLSDKDEHVLKKALAIAIATLEQKPASIQGFSQYDDMKALLARLVTSEIESETYARQARVALTGSAD